VPAWLGSSRVAPWGILMWRLDFRETMRATRAAT